MPTKRIGDVHVRGFNGGWNDPSDPKVCKDAEHDPPKHQLFDPGMYRHKCPSCGRTIEFVVVGPTW